VAGVRVVFNRLYAWPTCDPAVFSAALSPQRAKLTTTTSPCCAPGPPSRRISSGDVPPADQAVDLQAGSTTCDFNQQLGLPAGGRPPFARSVAGDPAGDPIQVAAHCFGLHRRQRLQLRRCAGGMILRLLCCWPSPAGGPVLCAGICSVSSNLVGPRSAQDSLQNLAGLARPCWRRYLCGGLWLVTGLSLPWRGGD